MGLSCCSGHFESAQPGAGPFQLGMNYR
jgi:hypothetical protein